MDGLRDPLRQRARHQDALHAGGEIKTNCDGSDGQSGSSFYYYYWNSQQSAWIPATIGGFSGHYCLAGCPASPHNAWPNVITRITPSYLSAINFFRFWHP